ncbi:MAG: hypothetical protein ACYDD1_12950 [Caulobacteraceae bacterium]
MSAILPDQPSLRLLMTTEAQADRWAQALEVVRHLSLRGVETTLVVLGQPLNADQRTAVAEIAKLAIVEQEGALNEGATSLDFDIEGIRLAMLAAQYRPDVVHLHMPALAANARFPCPLIIDAPANNETPKRAEDDASLAEDAPWRRDMTARGYASADLVLASDSPTRIGDALAAYRQLAAKRRGRS